jgi:chromosome partitioning protein
MAVAASESEERVVLVDTDPQKSAAMWGKNRERESPIIATASAHDIPKVKDAAQSDGMTLMLIDTPPHAAPEAARVVMASDLVIIPCRPTAFDLAAVNQAVNIVKAANGKAVFVLSACPPRAPEIAETRGILAGYGFPVAPVEITERRAFSRAVASGRAVTEFESLGKAAEEIRNLWTWIKGEL